MRPTGFDRGRSRGSADSRASRRSRRPGGGRRCPAARPPGRPSPRRPRAGAPSPRGRAVLRAVEVHDERRVDAGVTVRSRAASRGRSRSRRTVGAPRGRSPRASGRAAAPAAALRRGSLDIVILGSLHSLNSTSVEIKGGSQCSPSSTRRTKRARRGAPGHVPRADDGRRAPSRASTSRCRRSRGTPAPRRRSCSGSSTRTRCPSPPCCCPPVRSATASAASPCWPSGWRCSAEHRWWRCSPTRPSS